MDAIDDKEFEGSLISLLQDGDAYGAQGKRLPKNKN